MNNFGRQFQGNPNWPPPPVAPKGKGSKNQQHQQQMNMPGPPPNMPQDFNMHPGGPPPPPWNTHNSPPVSRILDLEKLQGTHRRNQHDCLDLNVFQQKPNQQGFPSGYYDSAPFCGGNMGPGQPGPNPNNPNMMGSGPSGPPPPGGSMPSGQLPPGYFPGGPNNSMPGNGPQGPMPTGIKIPDENLTPQQRLHREEQLAKMRTMQKLLFPENDHPHTPGDPNCHPPGPMPPHDNMNPYDMPVRKLLICRS